MVDCPQCGDVVEPGAIVGGVAQCPHCEHLFEAAVPPAPDTSAPQPPPPTGHRHLPPPPATATLELHDNGVEITLPWRADLPPASMLFTLGMVGLFLFFTAKGEDAITIAAMLALASLMLYTFVYYAVNATTVLIGPGGVEISHGPLPTFNSGRTYAARQVHPLSVETVEKGWGRHRRTVYELHGGLTGEKLLTDWNRRESMAFVRACIEAVAPSAPSSRAP